MSGKNDQNAKNGADREELAIDVEDLEDLDDITGRALLDGRITLKEALTCWPNA